MDLPSLAETPPSAPAPPGLAEAAAEEWRERRVAHLGVAVLVIAGALLPAALRPDWDALVLLVAAPVLAVWAAAGRTRDPSTRGVVARLAVQACALLFPLLTAFVRMSVTRPAAWSGYALSVAGELRYPLVLATLVLLTTAARTRTRGSAVVGPALTLLVGALLVRFGARRGDLGLVAVDVLALIVALGPPRVARAVGIVGAAGFLAAVFLGG